MKKLTAILILTCSSLMGLAQNTFPASGNVGIGTTSPATPLQVQPPILSGGHINRNVLDFTDLYNSGSNGQDLVLTTGTSGNAYSGWNLSSDWSGRLSLGVFSGFYSTTPNEYLSIVNGGNVGIGTTTPRSKLDLWGGQFYVTGADDNGTAIMTSSGGNAYFANNSLSNSIQITPSGNVGIGTSAPQSLLSVNGTITGKQVTVTQTGWSDFVFDKNYKLRPLSEIGEYIHMHKHLPDIPSTKQIESKGLNLEEMEQKQMMKIEELTLYVIQQDKKNAEQDRLIKQLIKTNQWLEKRIDEITKSSRRSKDTK